MYLLKSVASDNFVIKMASKYFIPYCIRPVYLQESESNAKTCGLVNGLIYCLLLTLIIGSGGLRFYLKEEKLDFKRNIFLATVSVIGLIWIVVPLIFRHGNGVMWNGYNSTINDLISKGYTHQEATRLLQGIQENGPSLQGIGGMVFMKSAGPSDGKDKNGPTSGGPEQPQEKNGGPTTNKK